MGKYLKEMFKKSVCFQRYNARLVFCSLDRCAKKKKNQFCLNLETRLFLTYKTVFKCISGLQNTKKLISLKFFTETKEVLKVTYRFIPFTKWLIMFDCVKCSTHKKKRKKNQRSYAPK